MEFEQQEKHNSIFDKVAIWDLEGEQKTEVAKTIIEDVETGIEYWSQMILSSIIATLWLLINATPVVIGAMLIAPILRPIQAVAFATTTWNRRLFWKWMWLLISSILIGIISAIIVTWIIPLSELTNEILMRTQPTLIDLWIAFASWCVAFLAFWFKRIAAWLAWVAMAASLVPPLAVVWIWIGLLNRSIWRWSWILFLTNLVAIIIAWIAIFYMFGYYPNQKKEMKTSIVTAFFSLAIMVWLSVPLATSLFSIIDDINQKEIITTTTEQYIKTIDAGITLENFTYNDQVLSVTIRAPAEKTITVEDKTKLSQSIAEALDTSVDLDLTIIPYVSASASNTIIFDPLIKINNHIDTFLSILYPPVVRIDSQLLSNESSILLVDFYSDEQFDIWRFKEQLHTYLDEKNISIDTIIIDRQSVVKDTNEITKSEQQRITLINSLESSFRNEFTQTYLHNLDLLRWEDRTEWIISLVVTTPLTKELFEEQLGLRKATASALTEMDIEIKTIVQFGEEVIVE